MIIFKRTGISLILVLVLSLLVLTSCSPTQTEDNDAMVETNQAENSIVEESENADGIELTIEELKMYDGTNGNPAYIAYDGVIYDVTNVSQWTSGSHGGNSVGTDITEKLNSSPHGTSKLNGLEIVGKIR